MAVCVTLSRKKRRPCIGDLEDLIILQDRDLTAVNMGVDATETFTEIETVYAKIETVRGLVIFDGVNTETNATHIFTIEFLAGITAETWVEFELRRFDILTPQDFEERHEFLELVCAERGAITNRAVDA